MSFSWKLLKWIYSVLEKSSSYICVYQRCSNPILRIGYRSDETDPNPMLCIYYSGLLLSPRKPKKIIKHHKVFMHYTSSVLKLFHSLIQAFQTCSWILSHTHFACLLYQSHLIQLISSLVAIPRPEMSVSVRQRHAKCEVLGRLQERVWEPLV